MDYYLKKFVLSFEHILKSMNEIRQQHKAYAGQVWGYGCVLCMYVCASKEAYIHLSSQRQNENEEDVEREREYCSHFFRIFLRLYVDGRLTYKSTILDSV